MKTWTTGKSNSNGFWVPLIFRRKKYRGSLACRSNLNSLILWFTCANILVTQRWPSSTVAQSPTRISSKASSPSQGQNLRSPRYRSIRRMTLARVTTTVQVKRKSLFLIKCLACLNEQLMAIRPLPKPFQLVEVRLEDHQLYHNLEEWQSLQHPGHLVFHLPRSPDQ